MKREKEEHIYETVDGIKIEYGPVSLVELEQMQRGVEAEYRERGEPVDPPTYKVEVAGGDVIEYPHTEKSKKSEAEEAAWKAHLEAAARMRGEQNNLRKEILLLGGLKAALPEPEEGQEYAQWERRQRRYKIRIPEDPDEKLLHYIETVLLKVPEDAINLAMLIMRLSSRGAAPQEAIDAAEATFRGQLQGQTASGVETKKAGTVAAQRKVRRGPRGKKLGADAGAVPEPAGDGTGGDDRV